MKKTLQKTGTALLALVLSLSLAAGLCCFGGSVSAKAASGDITVKPDSDFALKLPANWKGNYVTEKSKNKKHGSYVSFSAKKCHKETGDGWLFSIMRYKDDSYTDLPSFELVGKWGGFNYVAVFPTETQTYGASKAAEKQYQKLAGGAFSSAASIRPAKKRTEGATLYLASDFSLKLTAAWKNNYTVETTGKKGNASYVAFYAKKCREQNGQGWLFSIGRFTNEDYQDFPAYELVGKWNGTSYVAVFPTDVQFEGVTKAAAAQYQKLSQTVEKVARTIQR